MKYREKVVHTERRRKGTVEGHVCEFESSEAVVGVEGDFEGKGCYCVLDHFDQQQNAARVDCVGEVGDGESGYFEGGADNLRWIGDYCGLDGGGGGGVGENNGTLIINDIPFLKYGLATQIGVAELMVLVALMQNEIKTRKRVFLIDIPSMI